MIKREKAEKWAARSARLSAALRENLKRRKAQARRRAGAAAGAGEGTEAGAARPADSAAADKDSLGKDAKNGDAAPEFRRNPGRD